MNMPDVERQTILLAEGEVIVRLAIGEYLRGCGQRVVEAADAVEAKAVLQSGLEVHIVMSDAQLAGEENGFGLARWVRRYRPDVEVILTSTITGKAQAAAEFCAKSPSRAPYDSSGLAARIRTMMAERKRRTRPPSSTSPLLPRRRRS